MDYSTHPATSDVESPTIILKTALHYLLCAGKSIVSYDSARLLHQWRACMQLLLAAGCSIQQEDVIAAEELRITKPIMEEIRGANCQPLTLKKLCNAIIRRNIQKPLKSSVAQLGLPTMLKKFVSLEVTN